MVPNSIWRVQILKIGLSKMDKETEAFKNALDSFPNDSAFMIDYERSIETEKGKEALIQDPLAKKLAGKKGKQPSDTFGREACTAFGLWSDFHKQWTVVRIKFIDDAIKHLIVNKGDKELQLLNLGAGLDTRVFQLQCLSLLSWATEVDMEEIKMHKEVIFISLDMNPLCKYTLVSVDLTKSGALEESLMKEGFDKTHSSILLAEGLIMYLGGAQRQFIQEISSIAAAG